MVCPHGPPPWTGRQLAPYKKGSISKDVPQILERLNLSADLWLHAVEQFGKRRAANRITPASRFTLWQVDGPFHPAKEIR